MIKEHKDIKLLIIGSINFEDSKNSTNAFSEELQSIAYKLNRAVSFTGFIPYKEIPRYLATANVAIIPSHINEAFGMTCIEACAMGMPVIATNDGGIPETLIGQKHILIEKERELPGQIADAILTIKNNYSKYKGNNLSPHFNKEHYSHSFFENIKLLYEEPTELFK
jgi:glycosyltransferase involved in cell wall biosynthesis